MGRSALFVAGPGAHYAIVPAVLIAAVQGCVLGLAEMGVDRPAIRAAGMLGIDRERRAAAADAPTILHDAPEHFCAAAVRAAAICL